MTIRKLDGKFRLYSTKGRNLGTFNTKEAAIKHEHDINFFKYKAKHMST